MKDCYKILGVPHNATLAEIKHAFRQKAKLLHPDITGQDSREFRELKSAYETLSDLKARQLFDESYSFKQSHNTYTENPFRNKSGYKKFDYRKWLSERTDDESRAKLILFDLLHNNDDEAVAEFAHRIGEIEGGTDHSEPLGGEHSPVDERLLDHSHCHPADVIQGICARNAPECPVSVAPVLLGYPLLRDTDPGGTGYSVEGK